MDLWASVRANATTRVERLVADGDVHVDERNDLGETALHVACSLGLDEVASVLLAHGANVGLRDWESGWTALHRSVYNAHLSTSLLLLRHARQVHGRQFMKELLYETRDFAHQSAMQLASCYEAPTRSQFDEMYKKEDDEEKEEKKQVGDDEDDEAWERAPPPAQRRGGMVYTFGKVDFQLGYHLPHVNVQSSPRLVELPITSAIVQISASKFHTIALNDRGQVYVWGFGKGGRLGTGTEFDHVEPTRLTSLDEIPMVRVAAGENHTLALSRSGQVFSWGSNSFGQLGHNVKTSTQESRLTPKRIDAFKGMHMSEISASGVHSGAICYDDGFVYTWGSNKRGQLGRKEGFGIDQPNPTPKRVDRLVPGHALSVIYEPHDALRSMQVAMSDVHTCVILRCSKNGQSHGQVWQFGYGSNVPTRILFKEKRRTNSHLLMNEAWLPRWKMRSDDIVSISCAPNHSIALSACGSVYTWGHNGDALSHQQSKDYIPPGAPQRVMLDKYGPIVSICASQDHCAVVSKAGDLVSWGCGPQGVLGHGPGNSWQPSPKQVHGAKKVIAVAAGHQHTAVLVAPRLPEREMESRGSSPPKLRNLLETRIAQFLDLSNVATVWKYANTYSQLALEQYCIEYMRLNWDGLLEMGSKDRLDVLFELMLAPSPKLIKRVDLNSSTLEEKVPKVKLGERKSERKVSISLEEKKLEAPKPEVKNEPAIVPMPPPKSLLASPSPELKAQPVPASARRVKGAKFVSVDSFFSEKELAKPAVSVPPAEPRSFLSPWSQTPVASGSVTTPITAAKPIPTNRVPDAFPSLGESVSRPPRKESVDRAPLSSSLPRTSPMFGASPSPKLNFAPSPVLEPRKHVLHYDGSERPQVAAFSLDAFIKKSTRKKSRGDSFDLTKPTATWATAPAAAAASLASASPLKSLKEIQEEEQARAKAEAEAKAKNGGFVRKTSSVNSWGLVQQQGHISFEELQRREEEERFLEEQRQILAQIERENRQREADEKRRLAKQQQQQQQRKKGDKKSPTQNQSQNQQPRKKAEKSSESKPRGQKSKKPDDEQATTEAASEPRANEKPKGKSGESKPRGQRGKKPEGEATADTVPETRAKDKPLPKERKKADTKGPTTTELTGVSTSELESGEKSKAKPKPRRKPSKPKEQQGQPATSAA